MLETAVSNRPPYDLAQEVVAALGTHSFGGISEILAVGGGVARVRDELHGAPKSAFLSLSFRFQFPAAAFFRRFLFRLAFRRECDRRESDG